MSMTFFVLIESLACQTFLVNDVVVRREVRKVVMLSTEGNKTITLSLILPERIT
jgi:Tfp pilus assembly major pilin PilA